MIRLARQRDGDGWVTTPTVTAGLSNGGIDEGSRAPLATANFHNSQQLTATSRNLPRPLALLGRQGGTTQVELANFDAGKPWEGSPGAADLIGSPG